MAIAYALVSATIIPQTSAWLSTYSGASAASATVDLAAGVGLLATGTAIVLAKTRPNVGWLAVLAGVTWLASDWIGWQDGPALPRMLAMAAALFYLPLILHLLAIHQLPPRASIMRALVLPGYAVAAGIGLAMLLVRDPSIDVLCWNNCGDNPLLVGNVPLAVDGLRVAVPAFEVAAGAGTVAVALAILTRGTAVRRRTVAVVAVPGALVGVMGAVHGVALLLDPHEGPRFASHVAIFQLRAVSAAMLAGGLAWTAVRPWRSRLAVERLATDLHNAPPPGTVESALATAVDDPSLEFLYWLPHVGRYVDGAGRPREAPVLDERRSALRVMLAGRLVCLAVHDRSAVDAADLDRLLGPATRLALENERLRAELFAKVEEVRASGARIVATADAARASMERDLHDGAQQALLAVAFDVQAAAQAAAAADDTDALGELRASLATAEEMLADLREIAHGIYPAVLTDRGLGPALSSLADRAAIPVEIQAVPTQRLPQGAELAGYAVVAGAVDAAIAAGADGLTVRGSLAPGRLQLEIQGIGTSQVAEITDRVSAVDGGWSTEGRTLRVWIPCA